MKLALIDDCIVEESETGLRPVGEVFKVEDGERIVLRANAFNVMEESLREVRDILSGIIKSRTERGLDMRYVQPAMERANAALNASTLRTIHNSRLTR